MLLRMLKPPKSPKGGLSTTFIFAFYIIRMKQDIVDLLRIFGVATFASIVRVFYHKQERLIDNIITFSGGTILGALCGYLAQEMPATTAYSHVITAGMALVGKEVTDVLITEVPKAIKRIITKFSK